MKIVVVGDEMFCTAFRLAGISDVISTPTAEKVESLLSEEDVGVVIIQEEVLESLPSRLQKVLDKVPKPMFVPLSLKGKEGGEGLDALVRRALGVDLR